MPQVSIVLSSFANENPIAYSTYSSTGIGRNKLQTGTDVAGSTPEQEAKGRLSIGTPDSYAVQLEAVIPSDYRQSVLETEWAIYLASDPVDGSKEERYATIKTSSGWTYTPTKPQIILADAFKLQLLLKHRTHYAFKVRMKTANGWSTYSDLHYFKTRDTSYSLPSRSLKTEVEVINGKEVIKNLNPEQAVAKLNARTKEYRQGNYTVVNAKSGKKSTNSTIMLP